MPAGMPRFAPNQTPPIQRTAPPLPASGSWQPIRTRLPSGTPHPSGTSSADGFTVHSGVLLANFYSPALARW